MSRLHIDKCKGLLLLGLLMSAAWICGIQRHSEIEIVFDVNVHSATDFELQIFYSDHPGASLIKTLPLKVGVNKVSTILPIERLRELRVDFGSFPGKVTASPISLRGRQNKMLSWHDFRPSGDIDSFTVGDNGSVDMISEHGDPYAYFTSELDFPGKITYRHSSIIIFSAFFGILWWLLAGPKGIIYEGWIDTSSGIWNRNFALLAAIAIVARWAISSRLPWHIAFSGYDDIWMTNSAESLLLGDWLGAYTQRVLIKGCFSPMVLAFAAMTGLTYLGLTTILYIFGCLFFLWVVSSFVRNRTVSLLILLVLLFNPLSFAFNTWQKIYRNGMALWQVPLLFGSLYMMYRTSSEPLRKMLRWSIIAGVSVWVFFNTREDGMWAWPFILTCIAFSSLRTIRNAIALRAKILRGIVAVVPIAILLFGNMAICLVNKAYYGIAMRNDRDSGNYAKAMRDLYLIKPDPADEARLSSAEHAHCFHNIYYSTLCKAYLVSPTLRSVREQIDANLEGWGRQPQHHGKDLIWDHVLFSLREGVFNAGYYNSLPESERFWGEVHKELKAAFEAGKLESRGFSFTAMAAPLKAESIPGILREWWASILHVANFDTSGPMLIELSPKDDPSINRICKLVGSNPVSGQNDVSNLQPYVDRAIVIRDVYSMTMPYVILLAVVGYLFLGVILVKRGAVGAEIMDPWLFATGIGISFLLHSGCVSYISATTFPARADIYLCSSYQLELMFVVVVAGMLTRLFFANRRGTI